MVKGSPSAPVRIQGGGNIFRQYLNSGLVDEFTVHVAPIVLGSGIRLFDNLDRRRVSVEIVETLPSRLATHIRYKVRAKGGH